MRLFRPTLRQTAPLATDVCEWEPTFSLDRHAAQARRTMGEAKWSRLMREWVA